MNIAKPAYDADMKVKADMKKADSSRAQHAVQSKKNTCTKSNFNISNHHKVARKKRSCC